MDHQDPPRKPITPADLVTILLLCVTLLAGLWIVFR